MYNTQIIFHHAGHISNIFSIKNIKWHVFFRLFLLLQTCTPEWRTSFLKEATPAPSNCQLILGHFQMWGSVVACRTPEREVGGSKPTAAVLCPWARHFTPRKYWLITQEAVAPSRHDWKIVDWDVKPQHKRTKLSNVSVDIGVIRMQDKATETRKTAILTEKKNTPTNQISFEKRFYFNSTELYMEFACLLE